MRSTSRAGIGLRLWPSELGEHRHRARTARTGRACCPTSARRWRCRPGCRAPRIASTGAMPRPALALERALWATPTLRLGHAVHVGVGDEEAMGGRSGRVSAGRRGRRSRPGEQPWVFAAHSVSADHLGHVHLHRHVGVVGRPLRHPRHDRDVGRIGRVRRDRGGDAGMAGEFVAPAPRSGRRPRRSSSRRAGRNRPASGRRRRACRRGRSTRPTSSSK